MKLKNIKRLFNVIENNCFMTGNLSYERLTAAIIQLANAVEDYEGDTEELWYIQGKYGVSSLPDLIIGAYWHYTEWHQGQNSQSYVALCALGKIFNPNMSTVEHDNEAYLSLNNIAQTYFHYDIEDSKE